MANGQCNCYSPSFDVGPPEGQDIGAVLLAPPHLGLERNTVSVDACIVPVVKHLWAQGIVTRSSCCGHGKKPPSLVLEDSIPQERAKHIRALIAEVDKRQFDLYSWKLVGV